MGWSKGVKSSGGLTEGLIFLTNLGDSSEVHEWGNPPQVNLEPGSGNIMLADWGMGNEPHNTWIPANAGISMITLGALARGTWYDAFEILCQKKPVPIYLVLKICRQSETSDSTLLYDLVLVKRTKDSTITDEVVSQYRTYGIYNGAGHSTHTDTAYFYCGQFDYGGHTFYGAGLCNSNIYDNWGTQFFFTTSTMFAAEKDIFWGKIGTPDPEGEVSSPEFGPGSEPGGGYVPGGGTKPGGSGEIKIPSFDNTSDLIPLPTKPQLSALDSIFFHAYKVTKASMHYIADALFPQPVWTQNDLIMMMGEIGQMLFFNKQIDYMLDALILPIDVPAGDWEHIRVGGHELKTVIEGTEYWINGMPVEDPYVDFPCGSLSIDEYWVNFLDFAGTKVKLFLPYVGYVDIQPEYVIGGTLYVDYRFNVIDGSFMCYVRSDSGYSELEESMIGQYAGVAAVHIPLQSLDYSNKISGLISAIGSVAAGAASGGIGASIGIGAGANAANTLVQKPGSSHANGYNASSSFLSNKTPYLIIERQWGQFSEKYPDEVGLPSNVKCRIGDLSGLVKSENAHLDTIPCSAEMKDKISSLLADGIIVG